MTDTTTNERIVETSVPTMPAGHYRVADRLLRMALDHTNRVTPANGTVRIREADIAYVSLLTQQAQAHATLASVPWAVAADAMAAATEDEDAMGGDR